MEKKLIKRATLVAVGISVISGLCGSSAMASPVRNEVRRETVSANVIETSYGSRQEPEKHYYINEAYRDIYSEDDLRAYFEEKAANGENVKLYGAEEIPYFDNYEAVLHYVKERMVARDTDFAFSVPMDIHLMQVGEDLRVVHDVAIADSMDEMLSTSCKDGDYLKANYIGTEWIGAESYDYVKNVATYTIRNIYTSTAEQEARVDAMIPQVLASLELDGKTEYEKIKIIHDYVVEHIVYDEETLNQYYETGKTDPAVHSTYAALIKGKTVCQGYASLFDRLCEEAGLESGYEDGYAVEPHAWNIVKLEGLWYKMDVTWDDAEGENRYLNFLQSEESFADRVYGMYYTTDKYKAAYPLAQRDYEASTVKELNISNPSLTLPSTSGSVSTTVTGSKPKVLYFYDTTGRSAAVLKEIQSGNKVESVSDFYMVEGAACMSAVNTYCSLAEITPVNTFPYIVVIDTNDKVRLVVEGFYSEEKLVKVLEILEEEEEEGDEKGGGGNGQIPGTQPGNTTQFIDVPDGRWFSEAIRYVSDNGIMNGIGNDMFAPNATTTRAMVVQILYNMSGRPEVWRRNPFRDVGSTAWYRDAVVWAYQEGITSGITATSFAPEKPVSRQELACFLMRYSNYVGNDTRGRNSLTGYSDYGSISGFALEAMQWANNAGIVNGKGNGLLDPLGDATRAEVATMIYRYKQKY